MGKPPSSDEACESTKRLRSAMNSVSLEHPEGQSLIPGLNNEVAMQCLARVPLSSLWGVSRTWQKMISGCRVFQQVREDIGRGPILWLYTLVRTTEGVFCWYALDPLSGKWNSLPPMPDKIDFELHDPGCIGYSYSVQTVSTGKKLAMVAGMTKNTSRLKSFQQPALEQPFVFDTQRGQWKRGRRFNTPRKWCACGSLDGKIYVISGSGQEWDVTLSKTAECYDPDSDTWSILQGLDSSKFSGEAISAVSLRGKLYMASGKGVLYTEGAVYCPVSKVWNKMVRDLRRGWIGPCVAANDRFFMLDNLAGVLNTYDEVSRSWKFVLEDPNLKYVSQLVASNGKIFGILDPTAEGESTHVRIIDLARNPPTVTFQYVPHGQVISMQVLARTVQDSTIL